MNTDFTQKTLMIQEGFVRKAASFFEDKAVEAHVFGSIAQGSNDALSDVDIWVTFEDGEISAALEQRMVWYERFGGIVLFHEMQHNYPLGGVQTAVLYKIQDELLRVDFYLCPHTHSRILPGSKILFESKKVLEGNIIPETKRVPRDISDRITFFIMMCFNSIKKVVRGDKGFVDFLNREFKKYEKEIPVFENFSGEPSFKTIRKALDLLDDVSNSEQRNAIVEIKHFLKKIESAFDS